MNGLMVSGLFTAFFGVLLFAVQRIRADLDRKQEEAEHESNIPEADLIYDKWERADNFCKILQFVTFTCLGWLFWEAIKAFMIPFFCN